MIEVWGWGGPHEDLRALQGCEQGLATLTSGPTGQRKLLELGRAGGAPEHSWGRSEADATGPLLPRTQLLPSRATAQGDSIGPGVVLLLLGHLGEDLCEGRGR